MKPSEDIKPITYMKTRSAELIATVNRRRKPIIITQNGEAKVVVQDVKEYEKDQEALLFLKLLSPGIADIEKKRLAPQDALFDRLENKIRKLAS